MTVNGDIATRAVEMLSQETEQFKDITFVMAYENEIKPTPLEKPICAISVKKVRIGERDTKTLDTGEIIELKQRHIYTTLSIDIYLPYSMGGIEAHRLFDRIATYLVFERECNITEGFCTDTDYDKSCQALVLRSQFTYLSKIMT